MLKKMVCLGLVCASLLATVPVWAAEGDFAVSVGMEEESVATFEESRTFSGTAAVGDVVTISLYTENSRGNQVLRSSYELEIGASGLFSQSVPLYVGENWVEISDGDTVESISVRRYAKALKVELKNGISRPGDTPEMEPLFQ